MSGRSIVRVSLRHATLGLLAQHPASGYDLLKQFEISMANVWPATQSQLYGELNRLADGGLIEVSAEGPRGRKEYRITETGRAELRRWVMHPDNDPPFRSASLLRVFLLAAVSPEEARNYMLSVAENRDADLRRFEAIRDEFSSKATDDDTFYNRAALEYGLRIAAMEGEWARQVAQQISERSTT